MTNQQAIELIHSALIKLLDKDRYLIQYATHENTINARLARYLEDILSSDEIDVDVEYNKNGEGFKEYIDRDDLKKYARIDIIIHQRGNNNKNLIAFECKKGEFTPNDIDKTNALLRPPYNYAFTSLVKYGGGGNDPIEYIIKHIGEDGMQISDIYVAKI